MTEPGSSLSSIRDLVQAAAGHPGIGAVLLFAAPLAVSALGLFHGKDRGGSAPWKYLYSVFVYLACVPGMFSAVLICYTLFFTHENLLDVNAAIYFFPFLSMTLTLLLMRRQVRFDEVPGFDRLTGLMVMIAAAFGIVFALSRTRIWLIFGGSLAAFFALAAFAFALLKWGASAVFRGGDEPRQDPPKFPC